MIRSLRMKITRKKTMTRIKCERKVEIKKQDMEMMMMEKDIINSNKKLESWVVVINSET